MIGLTSPGNYSGPFWTYNFSTCLWERQKLPIRMIPGFSDVSQSPKTNMINFWDPRIPQIIKENHIIFGKYYHYKFRNARNSKTCHFWKRRAPENPAGPFNNIWKIANMGSRSSRKHGGIRSISSRNNWMVVEILKVWDSGKT